MMMCWSETQKVDWLKLKLKLESLPVAAGPNLILARPGRTRGFYTLASITQALIFRTRSKSNASFYDGCAAVASAMYVGSTLGHDEAAINSNYCLALRLSPLRLMPAIHSSSKSIIPQQQLRKLADSTTISGFCIRGTLTDKFELLRRVSYRKG